MRIKGKSVRSLGRLLPHIKKDEPFRIGIPVKGWEKRLREIGFPGELEEGLSLMPSVAGRVSEFNARGREEILSDQPKQPKHRMVNATFRDWQGNMHTRVQFRTYLAYPRRYIEGLEERITLLNSPEGLVAASAEITIDENNGARALHVVNLFLEYFRECDLLGKDVRPVTKIKRVQWRILPPGEYPWDKIKELIQNSTARLGVNERPLIEHRIAKITRHAPDTIILGDAGFDGYYVFGFKKKNLFVLESAYLDNATYVFDSNWQEISQLTKSQIINAQLHRERLIHNKTWDRSIFKLLEKA